MLNKPIAICEQMQQESGAVTVPEVLQPYMGGITVLKPKPKKLRPKYFFIPGVKYFNNDVNSYGYHQNSLI